MTCRRPVYDLNRRYAVIASLGVAIWAGIAWFIFRPVDLHLWVASSIPGALNLRTLWLPHTVPYRVLRMKPPALLFAVVSSLVTLGAGYYGFVLRSGSTDSMLLFFIMGHLALSASIEVLYTHYGKRPSMG